MRVDELNTFSLASEKAVVPSLGGDGVVQVRSLSFAEKMEVTEAPRETRTLVMLARTVHDEDGVALMSVAGWDAFAATHEDDFVQLVLVAKRVSGLEGDEVKKD